MRATLLQIAVKVALGAVLAAVLGAVAVVTVLPRAVHGHALNVLTGSMDPTIPAGSIVVIRPVDPATLREGDVITFQRTEGRDDYVTHRIIEVHTDHTPVMFTTKGDANPGPDIAPVPATAVRGKVWVHVPHLGAVRDALRTGGMGLLVVVIALVGYAISQVVSVLRERRESARPTEPMLIDHGPESASTEAKEPEPAPAPPTAAGVTQELLLASVAAGRSGQREVSLLAATFHGRVVTADDGSIAIAVAHDSTTIDQVVSLLSLWPDVEIERSGPIAIPRACARERGGHDGELAATDG